jgi:hypothetical protein
MLNLELAKKPLRCVEYCRATLKPMRQARFEVGPRRVQNLGCGDGEGCHTGDGTYASDCRVAAVKRTNDLCET